jgi:hypothetical protein
VGSFAARPFKKGQTTDAFVSMRLHFAPRTMDRVLVILRGMERSGMEAQNPSKPFSTLFLSWLCPVILRERAESLKAVFHFVFVVSLKCRGDPVWSPFAGNVQFLFNNINDHDK